MKCEYQGTKIGIEGETEEGKCNNDATNVLRLITIPKSRIQSNLFYTRKMVCKGHSEYLCNDAEFKWENLPNQKVEDEEKRRGLTKEI